VGLGERGLPPELMGQTASAGAWTVATGVGDGAVWNGGDGRDRGGNRRWARSGVDLARGLHAGWAGWEAVRTLVVKNGEPCA